MSTRSKSVIGANVVAWMLAWLNAEFGTTTLALTVDHGCIGTDERVIPIEMGFVSAMLVSVATVAIWFSSRRKR